MFGRCFLSTDFVLWVCFLVDMANKMCELADRYWGGGCFWFAFIGLDDAGLRRWLIL